MRDEETGSYWQQVTGIAIAGPLKGRQLTLLPQDELTFGLWKKGQPNGTVLAPLPRFASKYEKATWESEIAKLPTVIHGTKGTLADRETIIGVVRNGAAQAYPLSKLTVQSPVLLDSVDGEPIMLVLGPDGKSVRVFSRNIGGHALEFYVRGAGNGSDTWALLEATSLSEWDFDGCALNGDMKGQCLARIDALKDYWFDWEHYHPKTGIYRR
jgi:Protein of unknown function (DUF3179)